MSMSRSEITRRLEQLEVERSKFEKQRDECEEEYRTYLRRLVEADSVADESLKDEVLKWLRSLGPTKRGATIKDWVTGTIGESPGQLTVEELREQFREQFGEKRLPSLRQYLTEPFGLVKKRDDRLVLTSDGKRAFRKMGDWEHE